MDKNLVKFVVRKVLDGLYEQIDYNLVCKVDQIAKKDDIESVGIQILMRTIIRNVEIMQCAPFYLTVTLKSSNGQDKYFFGISQMGNTPILLHISSFESKKMELELMIEALENREWRGKKSRNTIEVISLSNINFAFHHDISQLIVYINGARMVCIKYSPCVKRFIRQFISGLMEAMALAVENF